jgi:hypothetical protein
VYNELLCTGREFALEKVRHALENVFYALKEVPVLKYLLHVIFELIYEATSGRVGLTYTGPKQGGTLE